MREYLRYYWTDFLWVLPIIIIIYLGLEKVRVEWLVYADLIATFVVLVLLFNPFRFLSVLSFNSRLSISAIIILSFAAVQLPLNYISRVCILAVVALIIAVAVVKRKQWVYMESVKQSPDVDTILAHLSYSGFFQAGDEWNKHGCAETRALLHQAANMECPENLINSEYYAVYCLAWLHGSCYYEELQEQVDKLQETASAYEELEVRYKSQENHLKEVDDERKRFINEYNSVRRNWFDAVQERDACNQVIQQLTEKTHELEAELELLEKSAPEPLPEYANIDPPKSETENSQTDEPGATDPFADLSLKDKVPAQYGSGWGDLTRDQKIVAYNEAGMGYSKIGEIFGLSKPGVQSAIRRERARAQENPA